MARHWLFSRLHGPAGTACALPAVVSGLARYVRSADQGSCYFFDRIDGSAGPSVEVWLDATDEVSVAAADRLLTEVGSAAPRISVDWGVPRPVRHPHESERDVADELAAVSSEFALRVIEDGELGGDEVFALAVTHLRGLAGLVAEADRSSFLFLCWQHWAATLAPGQRVELAVEADLRAGAVGSGPARYHQAQRDYVRRTGQVIRGQRPGCGLPARYLVFSQAESTHRRLGIPPSQGAAAALVVRAEHAERSAPVVAASAARR